VRYVLRIPQPFGPRTVLESTAIFSYVWY